MDEIMKDEKYAKLLKTKLGAEPRMDEVRKDEVRRQLVNDTGVHEPRCASMCQQCSLQCHHEACERRLGRPRRVHGSACRQDLLPGVTDLVSGSRSASWVQWRR